MGGLPWCVSENDNERLSGKSKDEVWPDIYRSGERRSADLDPIDLGFGSTFRLDLAHKTCGSIQKLSSGSCYRYRWDELLRQSYS